MRRKPNGLYLNGVKRFITNGDSDIHLVLARSEEGTHDARGLSMFIYDKRDGGVNVRRIENKLGIHGSPTCELVYKNAKAELCGRRKFGLIKYVMALMNGARLGIAAQSVGISQAAYNEALAYAKDRKQFGQAIINFPAVYEMLSNIKARVKAMDAKFNEAIDYVKSVNTNEFTDLCSRHLYELAAACVMSQLLLRDATKSPELFDKSMKVYVNLAEAEVAKHYNLVKSLDVAAIENYKK